MKRPEVKKLYTKAWKKWGMQLQLTMLMEECAELIKATSKLKRFENTNMNVWRNFCQELADVEIMIDQMKEKMTWMDVKLAVKTNKHDKMLRLKKKLEGL